jgi:3-oxoacyl-[acyl-carrier protein] reductase
MSATTRLAVVTGASRGIGRAVLHRLARDGFDVIGTATTSAGTDRIGIDLEMAGLTGRGVVLRVDESESVARFVENLKRDDATPLVLVNNAGITRDNLLMRMGEAEWSAVVETNLSSLFRICKPLLRGMTRARWGRIVNISSVVARMGNAGQTNYAATKAGIEGFTRALAQEVGSRNVTVNAVAPGFIETDMTQALSEQQRSDLLARVPLGRLGAAEEVASVVSFLVSDGAAYITGETLNVNGGLYMA